MRKVIQDDQAVIWQCDTCHSWWGSRGSLGESSDALQEVMRNHPELAWENYRGWKRADDFGTACPECGAVTIRTLFTVDIPGE